MKKNKAARTAWILLALLLTQLTLPGYAAAVAETQSQTQAQTDAEAEPAEALQADEAPPEESIYIRTAEDLVALAQNCSLDSWSVGKTVILTADITLADSAFQPIPTFGGTFDGGGHTISGLHVSDTLTPSGLFGVLQQTAVVKDLHVSGTVAPSGDAETVGGIAGENYGALESCTFTGSVAGERNTGGIAGINGDTGSITDCAVSGAVFGEAMTGGVAGYNLGLIDACRNGAYVNITSVDPALGLDDINFDFLTDISKLYSVDTSLVSTDTGGIAGYSSGFIIDCANNATVGYPHIGYNAGGIVGRSCGYVYDCVNSAGVYGRKDVGGIVGQMEPYIAMELTEDTLATLREQLDALNAMIDGLLTDANEGVGTVTNRLNQMANHLDTAADAISNIQTSSTISTTADGGVQKEHDGSISVTPPTAHVGASGGGAGEIGVEVEIPPAAQAEGSILSGVDLHAGLTPGSVEREETSAIDGALSATTQIIRNTSLYQLTAAVNGLTGQMRLLNGETAGMAGTLTDDLKQINQQVDAISKTLLDAIAQSETGDVLTDTSEVDIDAATLGKIAGCKNSAQVNGDLNVGGIAGAMAIEYELDPEDDLTAGLSDTTRRQFELKAILQRCENTGAVTAKRNYAGSVCGYMDLGLITGCYGFGDTQSEDGSYAGGIAGLAGGAVKDCFAKCTLKGKRYVGGIVGSGVDGAGAGSSSVVSGCYALVSIPEYEQYAGGIAGADAGTFSENYYVAEGLAAINRLSYAGQAEPIAYEELLRVEGLPRQMRQLTLRFVADGETLRTRAFDYGDSLDASVYPDLPQKQGYYAVWDTTQLSDLRFDTVVTAVYLPYVAALQDAQCREDGRPIFFAEGQFQDTDTITITAQALTPAAFGVVSDSVSGALEHYFSFVKERRWPAMTVNREVVEQWSVEIPDDGNDTHTLRYLAPSERTDNLAVYVKQDGQWRKADTQAVGSYLVFQVAGNDAEVAAVSTLDVWWIWLGAAALILLLVLLIIRLIRKASRHKAAAKAKRTPVGAAVGAGGGSDQAQQDDLLRRALAAEAELAKTQQELRALKNETARDSGGQAPVRRKKRRWMLVLIVAAVALGCLAVAAVSIGARWKDALEAGRVLQRYAGQEELRMELTVQASVGEEQTSADVQIVRTQCDGKSFTCITQDGVTLYYCEDAVYLENGKAYRLSGLFPDYTALLQSSAELYTSLDVSKTDGGDGETYLVTAEGENAKTLLELLLPREAQALSDTQKIVVELDADGRQLSELRFEAGAAPSVGAETEPAVRATLRVLDTDEGVAEIPAEVRQAAAGGAAESADTLTEDLFRLLSAYAELARRDALGARLQLDANCGPLVVSDTLELLQTAVDGQTISCIRKNGRSVYFNGRSLCDQDGNAVTAEDEKLAASGGLWQVAYQACLNGELSRTEEEGAVVYSLTLDEAGMQAAAYAIAPDTEHMGIAFETGSVQIRMQAQRLCSVQIDCGGTVEIAAARVPVSLSAMVEIDDETPDFAVPEAVVQALDVEN